MNARSERLEDGKKGATMNVALTESLRRRVILESKAEDCSRSWIVRRALIAYFRMKRKRS